MPSIHKSTYLYLNFLFQQLPEIGPYYHRLVHFPVGLFLSFEATILPEEVKAFSLLPRVLEFCLLRIQKHRLVNVGSYTYHLAAIGKIVSFQDQSM
jgi:hypothetical protein